MDFVIKCYRLLSVIEWAISLVSIPLIGGTTDWANWPVLMCAIFKNIFNIFTYTKFNLKKKCRHKSEKNVFYLIIRYTLLKIILG